MITKSIFKTFLVGAMLTAASAAPAVVVTALPGGTAIPIPGLDLVTNSSTAIGGGITFTSNVPGGSTLGNTGTTVFGNGTFGPGNPYLSLNVAANGYNYATMSLTFATPTSGFLADIRWTDGGAGIGNLSSNTAFLAAYDSVGTLLEYVAFNNNAYATPTSPPPGTYGFLRLTADIARIDFDNAFMGARDLQYIGPEIGGPSAVPEPETWIMAVVGFGLLGGASRRQRASTSSMGLWRLATTH